MWLREGDAFRAASLHGPLPPAYIDLLRSGTLFRAGPDITHGARRSNAAAGSVLDLRERVLPRSATQYLWPQSKSPASVQCSLLPMLKEGQLVGTSQFIVRRCCPSALSRSSWFKTFAAQAVIAIENARLLKRAPAHHDLSKSLEDLRTTQDRLVQTQKLASLGQLTAGIAHEIKNPLNFVNNFSGVSAELIDELQDVLSGISIDHKARPKLRN